MSEAIRIESICEWCGSLFTSVYMSQQRREHLPVCPKHPIREVERERDELKADLDDRDADAQEAAALRARAEAAEASCAVMRSALDVATTHRAEDREEILLALSSDGGKRLLAYVEALERAVRADADPEHFAAVEKAMKECGR